MRSLRAPSASGTSAQGSSRRTAPLPAARPVACPSSACSSSGPASACSSSGRSEPIVSRRASRVRPAAAAATAAGPASPVDDLEVSVYAGNAIQYALELARTSETYEVHSWMILLGLLRQENSTACKVLKQLGLDDLYGAWHEVLWALNACDGLQPRAFVPQIGFQDRAFRILRGSMNFSTWRGHGKVQSEDLLMGLAAGGVLEGLFPDLGLTFPKVRKAVEKMTGYKYMLPDEGEKEDNSMLSSSDDVL